MQGLSLVAASRGHSSSRCAGLSLSRPLLLRSTGSRRAGSVVVAPGPVAPQHVGSSQTRARTRVPCIGRLTLNHCATREALHRFLIKNFSNVTEQGLVGLRHKKPNSDRVLIQYISTAILSPFSLSFLQSKDLFAGCQAKRKGSSCSKDSRTPRWLLSKC